MNNDLLEKINTSAFAFLTAQTPTQLHAAIVKEALLLSNADYGTLFVYNSQQLQKAYSSSALLKITKSNYIKKALKTHKISTSNKTILEKQQPDLVRKGIVSEALIPLSSTNQAFGALFLYSTKENFFTNDLRAELQALRYIATLALAKASLQEASKKALETRDHFISLASHELRTPLTSINGYIQLLHTKMKNQNTQEARCLE